MLKSFSWYATLGTLLGVLAAAVIWIAAIPYVVIAAKVLVTAGTLAGLVSLTLGVILAVRFWKAQMAFLRRDEALAIAEARTAQAAAGSVEFDLYAKTVMLPLLAAQVADGRAIPASVAGINSQSYPLPVVKNFKQLPAPVALPELVRIEDIIRPDDVSLNRLVLGVGTGNEIISGALREFTHIGVAGSTQWGKSIFLQSLLYQILLAKEKTEVFLSDLGGTSFVDFGLQYADDVASTEKLSAYLWKKVLARKALYQKTGVGVRSLEMYNEITGDNLPYLIFICDETTILMSQSKQLAEYLMNLVSYAAKYGLSLILSGQNWKTTNIDSAVRDQFSSRIQFKAMDSYQGGILIKDSQAHEFEVKGRACAYLPELGKIDLQAPHIKTATIQSLAARKPSAITDEVTLAEKTALYVAPAIPPAPAASIQFVVSEPEPAELTPNAEESKFIDQFVALRDGPEKFSWRKLCLLCDRSTSGQNMDKIRAALDKFGVDFSEFMTS